MAKKLPPLNSLRAFLEAAKYQSFKKAASELGVTQGAVSKQIAILEDYLGLNLFERKHQSLSLTKKAKKYLEIIDEAFSKIETASIKLAKKSSKETLTVNFLPSLSNQWLFPRLINFKKHYPAYNLNIAVGTDDVDFDKNDTDIAIRISRTNKWKTLSVEKLKEETLLCVCSAKYKAKHPIKNAADLLTQNLLLHTRRPLTWRDYLKTLKQKHSNLHHDGAFQHFSMLITAAKEGRGIALIPDFLIEEDLKDGSLISAFRAPFKSGYSYYLMHPKPKTSLQKIEDFKYWIRTQFR